VRIAWENFVRGSDGTWQHRKVDGREESVHVAPTGGPWRPHVLGATVLTNLLMVLAVAVLWARPGPHPRLGLTLLLAAALDASWLYLTDDVTREVLRLGYFLWVASFALVGAGLVLEGRGVPAAGR
jgi:hypothetical protein